MPKNKVTLRFPCPKCHSTQTLLRKRAKRRWCRNCGHDWAAAEGKAVAA